MYQHDRYWWQPKAKDNAVNKSKLNEGLSNPYIHGEFTTTELDRYLYGLAKEYDEVCEAYDRTVCTGPVGRDGILPANGREMGKISRHAIRFMRELTLRAERERGLSPELVRNSIKKIRVR